MQCSSVLEDEHKKFKTQLEEGFDLPTDDRYNSWRSIYSPGDELSTQTLLTSLPILPQTYSSVSLLKSSNHHTLPIPESL